MKNISRIIYHEPIPMSQKKHENGNPNEASQSDSSSQDEAKAIAIPLFGLLLICLVIFILKLKLSKRKIGAYYDRQKLIIPYEDCRNLRFKNLIGRGSFGVVWRAVMDDEIYVAVKMCSVEKHEKWIKEKDILSEELNHPNIIKLIGSEIRKIKEETALLLIFEYLDRGDLRSHLSKNVLSVEQLLFFIQTLFSGLAFLHSWKDQTGMYKNAIAHRDMKSSNILISPERGCVIADFGLAVPLNVPDIHSWLKKKLQVGTARYMSPEKLSGRIECNDPAMALFKIDVYAASLVTYEILSRCSFKKDTVLNSSYDPKDFKLPFADLAGPHPSNEVMRKIAADQNIRPEIPTEWKLNEIIHKVTELIETCWSADVAKRLTSQQMLQEIKQIYLNFELQSSYSNQKFRDQNSVELNCNTCIVQMHVNSQYQK